MGELKSSSEILGKKWSIFEKCKAPGSKISETEAWCSQEHVQRETYKDIQRSKSKGYDSNFREALLRRALKDAINVVKLFSLKYNNALDYALVENLHILERANSKNDLIIAAVEAVEEGKITKNLVDQIKAYDAERETEEARLRDSARALKTLIDSRQISGDCDDDTRQAIDFLIEKADILLKDDDKMGE